jgi:hypothetical protein
MEDVYKMATKYMTQIESREDAMEILEQYQSRYFLAEIDRTPKLSSDGRITNIDEFIQIKNKPNVRAGSGNPVHKIYAAAPKAVSVILEAIDEMNTSVAKKQLLFDLYIEETKKNGRCRPKRFECSTRCIYGSLQRGAIRRTKRLPVSSNLRILGVKFNGRNDTFNPYRLRKFSSDF